MARYTGPKTKKARAFNEPIFGEDKYFKRKQYPPGQHGLAKRRKQKSDYGIQLMEKQKAKYTYGVLERQFRKTFEMATRKIGATGEVLLQLLEARLDNVVFRLGVSPTRSGARQLVNHGHICVNGVVTDIPSYSVRPGDTITVRGKSQGMSVIKDSIAANSKSVRNFTWLEWNGDKMEGTFLVYPTRDQNPEKINEQLIVELYSK
jgi:small subunit ribosomal protein S4